MRALFVANHEEDAIVDTAEVIVSPPGGASENKDGSSEDE